MNQIRTFMLMAAMVALFMGVGLLLGGRSGMMIALVIAVAMNAFGYWNADKMVLRMHNAREVGPEHPLTQIVAELVARAGLPMPKVYVVDQAQPNAFATGRNPDHAAVAATTGMLNLLDRDEIAAVMAHELAHVKNRDTLVMTVTATIAGAISMLGNWALFTGGGRSNGQSNGLMALMALIFAPIAAALVQMAISRTREYGADAIGSDISGQPLKLASALTKLASGAERIPNPVAEANPAAASLYIVPSLRHTGRDNLFSTHPATENRIAALQQIAAAMPALPDTPEPQPWPVAAKPSALGLDRTGTRHPRS